jgi:hypothetical protein
MISSNIIGGLGNQLFQIFTTISYAIDNNCDFIFPNKNELYAGANTTLRYTYWNTFLNKLQPYLKYENEINCELKFIESNDSKYIKLPELSNFKHIKEDLNVYLSGYFQSYKYFEHNFKKICEIIDIKKQKDELKINFLYNFNNEDFISLHFRIGDYVKYPYYHFILNDEYYINSIEKIVYMDNINNNKEIKILYFCEDENIELVSRRIDNIKNKLIEKGINNCFFLKCPVLEDWKEMLLMSLCKHNIIANSSFSWWGAYFNENVNKIVCYPSEFYTKNICKTTIDLFPDNWVKININIS